jgi:hypothetical protein
VTKAGNTHLRTELIESALPYRANVPSAPGCAPDKPVCRPRIWPLLAAKPLMCRRFGRMTERNGRAQESQVRRRHLRSGGAASVSIGPCGARFSRARRAAIILDHRDLIMASEWAVSRWWSWANRLHLGKPPV